MHTRHSTRFARGVRAGLVAAVITTGLTLANGAQAGALDQQQTSVTSQVKFELEPKQFQTITAGISGLLDRVDVWLDVIDGGCNVQVQIRTVDAGGNPENTVLGSGSVNATNLADTTFNPVAFSTPAPVVANTRYAIAVERTGSNCGGPQADITWGLAHGNPYTRGNALVADADADFAFKTYVDPLPAPTLETPANGSTTTDTTPTFSGHASTALGDDLTSVTIEIYQGTDASGAPIVTFTTNPNDQSGFFTTEPANALANGIYVARAVQGSDRGTGAGNQNVFQIDTTGTQPPPEPAPRPSSGSTGTGGSSQPASTPDTRAPDTRITSESFSRTHDRTPTFSFASDETNVRFECSLDGGDRKPCGAELTLPKLSRGDHVLLVTAIDQAGNADPSPARAEFKVKKRRR